LAARGDAEALAFLSTLCPATGLSALRESAPRWQVMHPLAAVREYPWKPAQLGGLRAFPICLARGAHALLADLRKSAARIASDGCIRANKFGFAFKF